jgi:hypothetical protein
MTISMKRHTESEITPNGKRSCATTADILKKAARRRQRFRFQTGIRARGRVFQRGLFKPFLQ